MFKSSRRQFVKNTALLSGGVLAMPSMLTANDWTDPKNPIKVAVVGCGGRGTGAAVQALSTKQHVKLVALADAFQDRVDTLFNTLNADDTSEITGVPGNLKAKLDLPASRRFVGFDAYQKAIPLADVVILATPPGFRPIHFEEAVKQGKHIFMEKPVATDPVGVRRVLAAAGQARQKKLNVVVGLQRRYQNSYRELFKRKDLIGDITSAQAWWNNDGVWVNPRKPGQTEMEYQMRNWYYFNWLCGDHICEQHIHNLDVVNWFKDAYPVSAQGMGGREVRKGKDYGEIFDHHFVEFMYADGTVLNSQCRHQPHTMSRVDELLLGTKGRIKAGAAAIEDNKGNVLYKFDGTKENNPYQTEHDELFEAIAKGEHRFNDGERGAMATMTAILGRLATYSGQLIKWDDALKLDLNLQPAAYAWDAMPKPQPGPDGIYPAAVPGVTKYV